MKRARKPVFDPKAFLAKADGGRTISKYKKDQTVYSQGEVADAVFYIQQARSKSPLFPSKGKKQLLRCLERATSLAKDAWWGSRWALRLPRQ
jgi:CRP/FNR family cyclic AMP-dependent transcriptional regulator